MSTPLDLPSKIKEDENIFTPKDSSIKLWKIILIAANIIIIAILLSISVIMVYFSSSSQRVIFGHTALLFTHEDEGEQKHSLYIVKADDTNVRKYDEIMFMMVDDLWRNVTAVGKVDSVNNKIVTFSDLDIMLDLNGGQYIGKVTKKFPTLGESLYKFTSGDNIILSYVLFGSGFVIVSLLIVLMLAVKLKKEPKSQNLIKEFHEPDEIVIENQPQQLTLIDDDDDYTDYNAFITRELEDTRLRTQEIDVRADSDVSKTEDEPQDKPVTHDIEIDMPDLRRSDDEVDAYLDDIIRKAISDFEKQS